MKMELDERLMIPERIRLPVLGGIWYRYLCKRKREQIRNVPIQSLSLNREKRETKLIFTLTSFPDRIDSVQYFGLQKMNLRISSSRKAFVNFKKLDWKYDTATISLGINATIS